MVSIGIIGCGYIGGRHAKHIDQHPRAKLVAVYDIDFEQAKRLAAEYGAIAVASEDEFLQSDMDIVHVCTPNGVHGEHGLKVLRSGKNALVEKPMEISLPKAEEMLGTAEELGRQLFVVKQNRFNPPVKRLKKLVEEGGLGHIYQVDVRCYWNRNRAYYEQASWRGSKNLDGGCLYTQFSHFIDVLYYLFGKPEQVKGFISNREHPYIEIEDCGTFQFVLPGNALGTLSYSTCSYQQNMEGSITVLAEKVSVKIGGKYLNSIEYVKGLEENFKDLDVSAPANDYGFYEGSMSNHDIVIDEVVRFLEGEQSKLTSGAEGLAVVQIISDFYQNALEIHG